jgi:hypothetical protein
MGLSKSDVLCDFTDLVSTTGISGEKYYQIPEPGTVNEKRIPLLTTLEGFSNEECKNLTYWTLDVLLPRGGSPTWETVWSELEDLDYEEACEDHYDEEYNEWYTVCEEALSSDIYITEAGSFYEIVIDFDQDLFINTIQVELESTNNTVKAEFRVAIRTETGTVLTAPTNMNKFNLTVTGREEYVNPCE